MSTLRKGNLMLSNNPNSWYLNVGKDKFIVSKDLLIVASRIRPNKLVNLGFIVIFKKSLTVIFKKDLGFIVIFKKKSNCNIHKKIRKFYRTDFECQNVFQAYFSPRVLKCRLIKNYCHIFFIKAAFILTK